MSDPVPSVPRPSEGPGTTGDDARIEQLLVSGLDHYFAGEFDAAINLWTRVLFLDRNHDRARAYIDRARSALAEEQRQTEALVHQGLDAFDRGDVDRARSLLSRALDRGAPQEVPLGVLGRIDRLDVTPSALQTPAPRRTAGRSERSSAAGEARRRAGARRRWWWWMAGVWAIAVASAVGFMTWAPDLGFARLPDAPRQVVLPLESPPVAPPKTTELYLSRGRRLFETGRLRDALAELERVPAGDPLRVEADRLRASIQRELLALALADVVRAVPAEPGSGRPPE
jgi:tetratricopeptide (TPR) repeat protein